MKQRQAKASPLRTPPSCEGREDASEPYSAVRAIPDPLWFVGSCRQAACSGGSWVHPRWQLEARTSEAPSDQQFDTALFNSAWVEEEVPRRRREPRHTADAPGECVLLAKFCNHPPGFIQSGARLVEAGILNQYLGATRYIHRPPEPILDALRKFQARVHLQKTLINVGRGDHRELN